MSARCHREAEWSHLLSKVSGGRSVGGRHVSWKGRDVLFAFDGTWNSGKIGVGPDETQEVVSRPVSVSEPSVVPAVRGPALMGERYRGAYRAYAGTTHAGSAGLHSRARRCASATCGGLIRRATSSRAAAWTWPMAGTRDAARLNQRCASTKS